MKKFTAVVFTLFLTVPPLAFGGTEYSDNFNQGTIEWAEKCIIQGSTSTVRVIDHDMNKTTEKPEQFDIRVWSDFDMIGTDLTVNETGNDTGVFEGTVYFSTVDKTNHRVQSFAGDTVYAKYVDVTLPNSHIDSEMIDSLIMFGLTVLEYQKHEHARYPSLILYDNPCVMEYRDKYKNTNAGQFSIFYPSPLKQIEMELQPDEIKCKENLELILRYDGSTVCVKPESISKLKERGWANTTILHDITEKDRVVLETISKNEILSKGIGFELPEDTFTLEDLKELEQKEKDLKEIQNDPDSSYEEKEKAGREIHDMQDRLQNPFQTGVPYHLVKILQEKYFILEEHISDLSGYVWWTRSSPNDISHTHHALRIGIDSDHFTLSELKHQDKKIREYLGNEMNIIYKKSGYITYE